MILCPHPWGELFGKSLRLQRLVGRTESVKIWHGACKDVRIVCKRLRLVADSFWQTEITQPGRRHTHTHIHTWWYMQRGKNWLQKGAFSCWLVLTHSNHTTWPKTHTHTHIHTWWYMQRGKKRICAFDRSVYIGEWCLTRSCWYEGNIVLQWVPCHWVLLLQRW